MAAYVGTDCVLQVTIGVTLTTVGAVRDITGPSMATTAVDTSTRAARARTFLPGLYDSGEITFDIVYDPDLDAHSASVAGGLVKLYQDQTVSAWKILFPTATTVVGIAFSAFVAGLAIKEPMDDVLSADLTLKISGIATVA